jgi:hypothetical protein
VELSAPTAQMPFGEMALARFREYGSFTVVQLFTSKWRTPAAPKIQAFFGPNTTASLIKLTVFQNPTTDQWPVQRKANACPSSPFEFRHKYLWLA